MLITLIQRPPRRSSPLTIGVSEDQADAVIRAMAKDGWCVLSKQYDAPMSPVLDCLQVALLDVGTLPPGSPIRVAVELGVAAAILNAPLWEVDRDGGSDASSGRGRHDDPTREAILARQRSDQTVIH
jgi:hypothetical protein